MYTMRRGGAYDRFRLMIEAFLERGCQVHCISLTPILMNQHSFYNHVIRAPFGGKKNLASKLWVIFLFPWHALFLTWRKKIDLFVAFGSGYAFILATPKLITRRPLVTLIRGDLTSGFRSRGLSRPLLWLSQLVEYLGLRFSNRIVTVNQTMADKTTERLGRRKRIDIQILPNNIPAIPSPPREEIIRMRAFYDIPEDGRILITAGILNRGKNIETVIRCLPNVGDGHFFLIVAGEGSTRVDFHYLESLRRLAKGLNLDRRVIFTGWLEKEELWLLFYAADLFILPSLSEGMPNVMLEALGCDLPCMGSNIPGVQDILQYDELMFDPLNPSMMAKMVMSFFSDQRRSDRVMRLCQERKRLFFFNWKEKAFQMVMS
jgi:glycosyltransferase involved in cell wall biosynthesis